LKNVWHYSFTGSFEIVKSPKFPCLHFFLFSPIPFFIPSFRGSVPPLPFSPSSSAAPPGSHRGPSCDPLELPSRELPQIGGGYVLMAARSATAELQRVPASSTPSPPASRLPLKPVLNVKEPDGATLSRLLLVCGRREGLQWRLHTCSRCAFHRLAGLQPKPLM
jgi:hypothetical protein